jgi:hypothetical protein
MSKMPDKKRQKVESGQGKDKKLKTDQVRGSLCYNYLVKFYFLVYVIRKLSVAT